MNQQEVLVKLAQVRLAINHVLRTRAMQKQADYMEYMTTKPVGLTEGGDQAHDQMFVRNSARRDNGWNPWKDPYRMTVKTPEKEKLPGWSQAVKDNNAVVDKTRRMVSRGVGDYSKQENPHFDTNQTAEENWNYLQNFTDRPQMYDKLLQEYNKLYRRE